MSQINPYGTPEAEELTKPTPILSAGGCALVLAALLTVAAMFAAKVIRYSSPPSRDERIRAPMTTNRPDLSGRKTSLPSDR